MWSTHSTVEFLTENSTSIIRHWRADAKVSLWHLPREQFDRGGDLRKLVRSTLANVITHFDSVISVDDNGEAIVPTDAIPIDSKHHESPATVPIPLVDLTWQDVKTAVEILAGSALRALRAARADRVTVELVRGCIDNSLCKYASTCIAQQQHELNARLEKSLVTKHLTGRFLVNVSHDLRTPLTAVLGFTELLQEETYGPLNSEQRQAVAHIVNSGQNLLETINNLIDLFQMREGQLKPVMRPCSIPGLIAELVQIIAPMAERHRVTMETVMDDGIPAIMVDETIVRHIIYNLLTTLIRAAPGGGTVIIAASTTTSVFTIKVTENSLLLPTGVATQLLEAYTRRENEPLIGNEGWGTGLSLVQRYVEVHLGQMQITPHSSGGVEFMVTLPTRTSAPVS
jgi:signal transduction histidine kinase